MNPRPESAPDEAVSEEPNPHAEASDSPAPTSLDFASFSSVALFGAAPQKDDRTVEELRGELAELKEALQRIEEAQRKAASAQARAFAQLEENLLGERRALAARNVFSALADPIDQMRTMRRGLDAEADRRMIAQLDAVLASLSSILRGLGFGEFEVAPGTLFDSASMEIVGFGSGPANATLKTVRSGYRVGETLLRPCSVVVGDGSDAAE